MTSLRTTLKKVFRNVKNLKSSMVLGPSDVIGKDYDILIVDEAHRLNRRVNITNMKDVYKRQAIQFSLSFGIFIDFPFLVTCFVLL